MKRRNRLASNQLFSLTSRSCCSTKSIHLNATSAWTAGFGCSTSSSCLKAQPIIRINFKPVDTICSASSSFTCTVRCAGEPSRPAFRATLQRGQRMRSYEAKREHSQRSSRWLNTSRLQYLHANDGLEHTVNILGREFTT